MRVLELFDDGNFFQLDVEVLVDALEDAADLDVVLELDGDLMVDERLEETSGRNVSVCMTHRARGAHSRLESS